MGYRYAILGAGRQGTAAAYDLARFGEAECILMADVDLDVATNAAQRVNQLTGSNLAEPARMDASQEESIGRWLSDSKVDVLHAASHYDFNLGLSRAAIHAAAGMTDLGGNSQVVLDQLDLNHQAVEAGVCIVPDCGLMPGMGSSLVLYALEQFDQTREVRIWDCGLPVKPEPPWNYRLTFSMQGLSNEYSGDCHYIRDGKMVKIPALEEHELLDFPEPIGTLEAFTTSGGLTSAARTFAGTLQVLQNKTLRYPGNFAQLKVMQQLGLFDLEPIDVDGQSIIPRHVLHALWEPQIRAAPDTRDVIIIHMQALGTIQGQEHELTLHLRHYFDEDLGFTAMEQGTGWHAAILTAAIARGQIVPGIIPVEKALGGSEFVQQAKLRGFEFEIEKRAIG